MTNQVSKKNFAINGVTYTIVYTSRSYIYHYKYIAGVKIRVKDYGGLNRIVDKAKQLEFAQQFVLKKYHTTIIREQSILLKALDLDKENLREKTYKTYFVKIKYWLNWLADNTLNETLVNENTMREFIAYLRNKNLKGRTIKSYFTAIKCMYRKCDLEPFGTKIKIAYVSTSLQHYTATQSEMIINYCRKNNVSIYFAIKFLFHCFIRPGELRLLQFTHINFENSTITIPGTISKNKKTQTVVIPNVFFTELIQFENYNKDLYIIGIKCIGSTTEVAKDYISKTHKKIIEHLQIKGNYAFYSWKHTGIIRAVQAGINLKDIQMQLRHHSLDMVNEYLKNLGAIDSLDLRTKMPTL